jgi:ribosomal protein L14E/L6E/L27E
MQTDAMNAGVNPGGLKSRMEIRVLICYILVNSKSPVPLETVKEQLHFDGIANYFETAFAISELEESGAIVSSKDENNVKLYSATDEAVRVSRELSGNLPYSVRERSLNLTERIIKRRRYERENNVTIETSENGVYITCSAMEKDLTLASVTLLVPDKDTANKIKERFLKNPAETLIKATEALIDTEI